MAGSGVHGQSLIESLRARRFGLAHRPNRATLRGIASLAQQVGRGGSLQATNAAMLTAADSRLEELRGQIEGRQALLGERRSEQQTHYQSQLTALLAMDADSSPTERGEAVQALQQAARQLFATADFDPDDYVAAELAFANEIPLYGDDERLRALATALGDVYALRESRLQASEWEQAVVALAELQAEHGRWSRYADDMARFGTTEWEQTNNRLAAMRRQWRATIQSDYGRQMAQWDAAHRRLRQQRADWFQSAAEQVIRGGVVRLEQDMGLPSEQSGYRSDPIVALGALSLPALQFPDAPIMDANDASVASLMAGQNFGRLMDALQLLSPGDQPLLQRAFAPPPAHSIDLLAENGESLDALMENIDARIALLTALRLRDSVDMLRERIASEVDTANDAADKQIDDLLIDAGYKRAAESYSRRTIIDRTLLGGDEYERNRIGAYRVFRPPVMDVGVDLSVGALADRPVFQIKAEIGRAGEALRNYSRLLFGDEEGEVSFAGISENFKRRFMQEVERFRSMGSDQKLDGLFAAAPRLCADHAP